MLNNQLHSHDTHFPSPQDHAQRWRDLGQAIAARRATISDQHTERGTPAHPGELIVLGSGIETVGFTETDMSLIRDADHVFYCVADPATNVWIKRQRPDAYDLYVLYDDNKLRYYTYMQMTEAMLHFVRAGQRVVAIFYGHPGIFVLSTHRAIKIARREGHQATMRASVSALDTLCADLGVDPSQPGMQTFEATDMLIRQRQPDPGLHVVLWQVGLIGDLGYRRQGYLNQGFSLFLDYLENIYGADQVVINYIGSRYPGLPPLIDEQTISSLRSPEKQARVTGISTFYLPPTEVRVCDRDMLTKLGLLKPGNTVHTPSSPLRQIDGYGPREMKAFDLFANFRVPLGYQWQPDTAGARFILALRNDHNLRRQYLRNPHQAAAAWPGLNHKEQQLLATGDPGALQIVAKGLQTQPDHRATQLMQALFSKKKLLNHLLLLLKDSPAQKRLDTAQQWSETSGYWDDWTHFSEQLSLYLCNYILPWVGLFTTKEGKSHSLIVLPGQQAHQCTLWLDGQVLKTACYRHGKLTWKDDPYTKTSGSLHTDLSPLGARRLSGVVWPAGQQPGSEHRLTLLEVMIPSVTLAHLAGSYRLSSTRKDGSTHARLLTISPSDGQMIATVDQQLIDDPIHIEKAHFSTGNWSLPFTAKEPEAHLPGYLLGTFMVRVKHHARPASYHRLTISPDQFLIDGQLISAVKRKNTHLSWQQGPADFHDGQISLYLDPVTLSPMLTGFINQQSKQLLTGMVTLSPERLSKLIAQPKYGIAATSWQHLVTVLANYSDKGGLFFWQVWEQTARHFRQAQRLQQMLNI